MKIVFLLVMAVLLVACSAENDSETCVVKGNVISALDTTPHISCPEDIQCSSPTPQRTFDLIIDSSNCKEYLGPQEMIQGNDCYEIVANQRIQGIAYTDAYGLIHIQSCETIKKILWFDI